jgi:RHS repeat-associated protein
MAYLRDLWGRVRDLLQFNTQTIVDHIDYDGFGNATQTATVLGDRYQFTAREFDSNTGLQYDRARYYDPATGPWLSEDPLGFDAGDANLYRYVGNEPTDVTDPSGLAAPPPGPERIRGNRFGDWTISQVGINAPLFGLATGDDADNWGSLAKITFTPAPGAVTADTVGFIQIVRITMVKVDDPAQKKDMTHRGPEKTKHRITRKGWAVDRQPRIFGWYGCDDTGEPEKPKKPLGRPITPWRPGNGKRPAVLEDVPSGPEPDPNITLPPGGWIIKPCPGSSFRPRAPTSSRRLLPGTSRQQAPPLNKLFRVRSLWKSQNNTAAAAIETSWFRRRPGAGRHLGCVRPGCASSRDTRAGFVKAPKLDWRPEA